MKYKLVYFFFLLPFLFNNCDKNGNLISIQIDTAYKWITLTGIIYDDYSHQPLQNVNVKLLRGDGWLAAPAGSSITDGSGRYNIKCYSHDYGSTFTVSAQKDTFFVDSLTGTNGSRIYPVSEYYFHLGEVDSLYRDIKIMPYSSLLLLLNNHGKEDLEYLYVFNHYKIMTSFTDSVPILPGYRKPLRPFSSIDYGKLGYLFTGTLMNDIEIKFKRRNSPYDQIIEKSAWCYPYKVTTLSFDF